MISNRFSKMLSTRLPPYIISSQWSENKKPNPQINCCIYQAQFYLVPIKILYSLYPLSLSLFPPPPSFFSSPSCIDVCGAEMAVIVGFQWAVSLRKEKHVSTTLEGWQSALWLLFWHLHFQNSQPAEAPGWGCEREVAELGLKPRLFGMSPSIREQPTRRDFSTQSNNATTKGLTEQRQGGITDDKT